MIEAMKQAIEALNYIEDKYMSLPKVGIEAITSLRQAIAEAEKQERGEPVDLSSFLCGYAQIKDGQYKFANMRTVELLTKDEFGPIYAIPEELIDSLYTHPQPKREPLTDEQIAEFFGVKAVDESFVDFVRAIEAAHGIKEKNT